jgi:hypothetical protein
VILFRSPDDDGSRSASRRLTSPDAGASPWISAVGWGLLVGGLQFVRGVAATGLSIGNAAIVAAGLATLVAVVIRALIATGYWPWPPSGRKRTTGDSESR